MVDRGAMYFHRLTPADWKVLLFTVAYLALALVAAIVFQNKEFVVYIVVTSVMLSAALVAHRRIGFHPAALWLLSVWGLAHMSGGLLRIPEHWPRGAETPVLYNLWLVPGCLKFDQLVHAYGFGLMTWICWQGLQRAFLNRNAVVTPTAGTLTLCAAAATGFGALNEVVEFTATLLLPRTNVGGYVNTGWDLVSNLVGSVLVSILIWFRGRSVPIDDNGLVPNGDNGTTVA